MPALNFKLQFAAPVKAHQKRQTIRAKGKREHKVGETLYMFSGLRTTNCKRLGTATLLSVQAITVDTERRSIRLEKTDGQGGHYLTDLSNDEALALARADGFASLNEFFAFFAKTHGPCVKGHLLKW